MRPWRYAIGMLKRLLKGKSRPRYFVFYMSSHYPLGGLYDVYDSGDDLEALMLPPAGDWNRNGSSSRPPDSGHVLDTRTMTIIRKYRSQEWGECKEWGECSCALETLHAIE